MIAITIKIIAFNNVIHCNSSNKINYKKFAEVINICTFAAVFMLVV